MKVLVGTLYSGENEFEECQAAIRSQVGVNFEQLIIRNKPELEAHRLLFTTFLERANEFELLVKVDADTVLGSPQLISRIAQRFRDEPNLEVLSIALKDFFTGALINGLVTFRNTVRWNFEKDTVFPDIPLLDPDRYHYDQSDLAPAGMHSPNPSALQAFHYGVHRGLKSIQKIHSTTHWGLLNLVWKNFLKTQDRRIGFAALGAELVYAGVFNREDQNYTAPRMEEVFQKYADMNAGQVKKEIRMLRLRHWGFLPTDLRRRVLRHTRGKLERNWDES